MDQLIDPGLAERQMINDGLERKLYPWFFPRCRVRILMYADGSVRFNGGGFGGLQRVLHALATDPWFWVTFDVTTAHRDADPSADMPNTTLDMLNLATNYDEVWMFGSDGNLTGYLSRAELTAVHDFMDGGGAVLVTGDHDSLGAGLAARVKRAGQMRLWDPAAGAPTAGVFNRNDTVQAGGDQSDAIPQPIRLKTFWAGWFTRAPHPLLCGPAGPINILPDHMHEGEAAAPTVLDPAEWPSSGGGFQPAPEAIAWGRVTQGNDAGQEFPVISVYNGHPAGVGRIVADSTWHHWFDLNLLGFAAGSAAETEIYAYFRNVAVWLAPPKLQRCMRRRLCWNALYLDPLVMLSPKLPLHILGRYARDAFGKYAPQCAITQWWWHDLVEIELHQGLDKLRELDPPGFDRLPDLVIGGVIQQLRGQFPGDTVPDEPPDDDAIEAAFEGAGKRAFAVMAKSLSEGGSQLRRIAG